MSIVLAHAKILLPRKEKVGGAQPITSNHFPVTRKHFDPLPTPAVPLNVNSIGGYGSSVHPHLLLTYNDLDRPLLWQS